MRETQTTHVNRTCRQTASIPHARRGGTQATFKTDQGTLSPQASPERWLRT